MNKLGVYYGHNAVPEDGVINGGNGVPPNSVFAVEGEGIDSFCGMDINSFMEGMCYCLVLGCILVFVHKI